MSESKSTSKDSEKFISVAPEEELLDVASIDALIEEEDPEFAAQLREIQDDKNLNLNEVGLTDAEQALAEEVELWTTKPGIRKSLARLFPFLPRVSLVFKRIKFSFYKLMRSFWIRAKNFTYFLWTAGRVRLRKTLKEAKESSVQSVKKTVFDFKSLPVKLKLFGFAVVLFFGFVVGGIYYLTQAQLFSNSKPMFLSSFASVADEELTNLSGESEKFYDNLRSSANLILLPRMVVNLRPSPPTHRNPMGAFEFFVEGMAPEVVLNIKMNESLLRDLIQRRLESYSFSELDSEAGKRQLVEALRQDLNQRLEGGGVKAVYVKNIVLKP